MTIDTRNVNGITILELHGKITIGEGSREIRETIRKLLDSGNKNILLSLGDVSYIDSSGIGELVSSYTTVTNQGGAVQITSPDQENQRAIGYHETAHRLR